MFSPTAQRSLQVRLLYLGIYALLLVGSISILAPFLIMAAGSLDSRSRAALLPPWLFDSGECWSRYLEARYGDSPDLLRMAWGDRNARFRNTALPPVPGEEEVRLWNTFLREARPHSLQLETLAFSRADARLPSYGNRAFRVWLLKQYGNDLSQLNTALETEFTKPTAVAPPQFKIAGPAASSGKLAAKYAEFCAAQPPEQLIAWNAGGYYRAVFLPRRFGDAVASYNSRYGTNYPSYREIPFPATAPANGGEDWFLFVSKVLRPDLVALTTEGEAARSRLGIGKEAFIRTRAEPSHLRVITLDVLFAGWAAEQGHRRTELPQRQLDRLAFEKESGFWKWQLLTQNYLYVFDEIVLHGRSILNTAILVVLCVAGALIVNPLAAYALSRFKLRQTYFILLFFLATLSFPAEVTMIPVFLQMKEFHLLNTFGALVLPGLANGFSIFLLKGFFDSLPKELYEAAELDGASEWMMFWGITMTLSRPILAVIALGAFTAAYGAFFYALILAPDPKMWTIMVDLYQLRSLVDPPVVYASLILTALPTLLMFIFCQNLILRGIVVPSEK